MTMADAQNLAPAAELAKKGSKPFAGESEKYREARTSLLAEEIELRRQIQHVAAQRRAMPPGPVAKDYRFLAKEGHERGLNDICGEQDTAFTYFRMIGPERTRPVPMSNTFARRHTIPAPTH